MRSKRHNTYTEEAGPEREGPDGNAARHWVEDVQNLEQREILDVRPTIYAMNILCMM